MIRPSFIHTLLLSPLFFSTYINAQVDPETVRAEARAYDRSNTFSGYKAGNPDHLNGSENVGLGMFSLGVLEDGSYNVAAGSFAGSLLENGDSNIYIGNEGRKNESHTIRIGTHGNGDGKQNRVFVAGVDGTAVSGIPVVVAPNGQLGQQASSILYKHTIAPMGNQSSALMDPQAVPLYSFYYSTDIDPDQVKQYGFMAEDLAVVYPELISNDSDGNPCYIQYFNLISMLLNELQKLEARVTALEGA